ncbi:MAG: aldehyde dehydrogenase family protein [Acidobacteriota bacterium]|nr:aldehyde dehydrogenase family protein [Acidobacteriota bacterium]
MLHLPLLRWGEPYRSLDVARVSHHQTRELFVEVSQANVGLIRRDLARQEQSRASLLGFASAELLAMCARAAEHLAHDTLPLGDEAQTPTDYVAQVTATTGLPHVFVRRNLEKIRGVLANMENVLNGLTRQLDLRVLDEGYGESRGQAVSFYPRAHALGAVLPNNSPGVHALWVPAVALKMPLVLKPGGAEPWTPYRIIQAFIRAGCPPAAFSFYPTGHAGAAEILRGCGRGMVFGDAGATESWRADGGRVEVHGPGFSKIVLGRDSAADFEQYLDVITASIAENGGRSCVNASSVWVPAPHGREIANAIAARLARIAPRHAADEEAQLAPFADANVARRISAQIDSALGEPGAHDVTAEQRSGSRLVEWHNCAYLLPTIIHCETPAHPLANREYLFPFASVVEYGDGEVPAALGPSLVVTAITDDQQLIRQLLASPHVDRLNIGPVPTNHIAWDQPHEGNLFEHLYARRAFQKEAFSNQRSAFSSKPLPEVNC